MSGVFITRGMTVVIPPGGLSLSMGPEGKPRGALTLHVHYDVCPTWLELAARHQSDAEHRKADRIVAWNGSDDDAKAKALEREFESSMQAIMAAAIAVDSFYLSLRDKTNISDATVKIWREKRTARYKQVAEIMRRAFSVAPRHSVLIRNLLKDIFKFRDLAVHPPPDATAPVLHPELQTGVEWRFAVFRADNAKAIVHNASKIIHELLANGKPSTPDIQRYADGLRNVIAAQTASSAPPEAKNTENEGLFRCVTSVHPHAWGCTGRAYSE